MEADLRPRFAVLAYLGGAPPLNCTGIHVFHCCVASLRDAVVAVYPAALSAGVDEEQLHGTCALVVDLGRFWLRVADRIGRF